MQYTLVKEVFHAREDAYPGSNYKIERQDIHDQEPNSMQIKIPLFDDDSACANHKPRDG